MQYPIAYNNHVEKFIDKEVKRRLDEEYIGCFTTHVTHGAKVIAILGTILDACLVLLIAFKLLNQTFEFIDVDPMSKMDTFNIFFIGILAILGLLVHGLIFYGLKKQKSWAFLPYLIVKTFEIAVMGYHFLSVVQIFGYSSQIFSSILVTSGVGAGQSVGKGEATIIIALVFIVKLWFWSVIRLARIYIQKQEKKNGKSIDSEIVAESVKSDKELV